MLEHQQEGKLGHDHLEVERPIDGDEAARVVGVGNGLTEAREAAKSAVNFKQSQTGSSC
jgi:hypothetical protein